MEELEKLQSERGKLYGDFKKHCDAFQEMMDTFRRPLHPWDFYIVSKVLRWWNCDSHENIDSLIDLVSYLDLVCKKILPQTPEIQILPIPPELFETLDRDPASFSKLLFYVIHQDYYNAYFVAKVLLENVRGRISETNPN